MMTSKILKEKCLSCSITTFYDDGIIQFPDMKFYDPHNQEFIENADSTDIEQDDGMPNLEDLTIDDILSQDDPPKELYLSEDTTNEEKEIPDDVDRDTAWLIYYNDRSDSEDFNIYEHFGIPGDLDDHLAEALFEAAIPDRG
jgi:hypothetical protein